MWGVNVSLLCLITQISIYHACAKVKQLEIDNWLFNIKSVIGNLEITNQLTSYLVKVLSNNTVAIA